MIYIVSVTVMICFIFAGIYVGFTPTVHRIVEQDFLRRVYDNGALEGLQYADVCLRAKTIVPSASHNVTTAIPGNPIVLTRRNAVVQKRLSCGITIPRLTAVNPNVSINVTVNQI